ncbi:hypothetical protein Tco_0780724 [Tanacetum coccineum]
MADMHDRHRDMWLDTMSYEELLALEKRIRNVNTGLTEENISKCMEQKIYVTEDGQPLNLAVYVRTEADRLCRWLIRCLEKDRKKALSARSITFDVIDADKLLKNRHDQILEPLSKMTEGNKKQYIADVKVMSYLLQAIPNDTNNSVDACKNAKDMWERIKMLMFGFDVTSHVRHSRLMDEFNKFAAKEGESL